MIAVVVLAALLGGCSTQTPEQKAAEVRLDRAMNQMSKADYAECELVTQTRPRRPGEGFLEEIGSADRTNRLCLKAKLYRAGYKD